MKRQITIYESAQNGKLTVFNDVECNTLGELKRLLSQKGINYTNMDFIEGVTNTKLLTDDSRIPDNIPFKGKVTNNVFINILQKDAKIKSGIDYTELTRTELLSFAKTFAEEILERFGKNFTQVKSADLIVFLEDKDEEAECEDDNEYEEREEEEKFTTPTPHYACSGPTLDSVAKAVARIAAYLHMDISDLYSTEGNSFFSMEDMKGFLNK